MITMSEATQALYDGLTAAIAATPAYERTEYRIGDVTIQVWGASRVAHHWQAMARAQIDIITPDGETRRVGPDVESWEQLAALVDEAQADWGETVEAVVAELRARHNRAVALHREYTEARIMLLARARAIGVPEDRINCQTLTSPCPCAGVIH